MKRDWVNAGSRDRRKALVRAILLWAGVGAGFLAALVFRRNLGAEYHLFRMMGLFPGGPAGAPTSDAGWLTMFETRPIIGLVLAGTGDLVNAFLVTLMVAAARVATAPLSGDSQGERTDQTAEAVETPATDGPWPAEQGADAPRDRTRLLDWALWLGGTAVVAYAAADIGFRWWSASIDPATAWFPSVAPGPGSQVALGLLLISGLMASIFMTGSSSYPRWVGRVGVFAHGVALLAIPAHFITPVAAAIPMSLSAPFMVAWYLGAAWAIARVARSS